jgi:type IV pilus assembly protein PilA
LTKSGYTFAWTAGTGNLSYSVTASPSTPGVTGQRYFFTNQSGVIRANTAGAADSSSTPIS